MHATLKSTTLLAGLAALVAGPVLAQDNNQAAEATPPAEQCLQNLGQFVDRTAEDQFWVVGWGRSWGGYGVGTMPPPANPDATATEGADQPAAAPGATPGMSPWGPAGTPAMGVQSPRYQVRALYEAAYVLGQQGDEEGCQYLLSELQGTYDRYTARLRDAGVDPAEVNTWRQEQIALGRPVTDMEQMGRMTVDDVTGTDVRNPRDEYLGSISDVAFDARSGDITYVIIARGGFLGIGEDHVAVPWDMFRATPGLNTMILDVSESTLADAPTVDPDSFADPSSIASQDQAVEEYWSQQS